MLGVLADALDEGGPVFGTERGGENGIARFIGKSALDQEGVQIGQHVFAFLALAAPPGGGVGEEDFLAEQTTAQRREKGQQSRGFGEA